MYNINYDDYIFSTDEFLKDRLLYDILWYARHNAEILKSDCKSFVVCRSNDYFPAIIWVDDNITRKDFDTLAYCLKQIFRGKVPYFMVKESFGERVKGIFKPLEVEKQTGLVSYVMEMPPVKITPPKGEVLRNTSEADKNTLIEFIKGFQTDCFGGPENDEVVLAMAEKRLNSPDSYIYEVSGIPAGMAYCSKKSEGYCRIQMIYTSPEFRNKGVGFRMTVKVCERIFANGYKPNLYADASNPISNRLYIHAGFREVGRLSEIKMNGIQ